jgi:hypothetical protein
MLTEEELKKILPKVPIELKDIKGFPNEACICTNVAFEKAKRKEFQLTPEEIRQVVDAQFEKYQNVALQLLRLLMSGMQMPEVDINAEGVKKILEELDEAKKEYLKELARLLMIII